MSIQFNKSFFSPREQEIIILEKKYKEAFKADAPFYVLKSYRQTINELKSNLGEERKYWEKKDQV